MCVYSRTPSHYLPTSAPWASKSNDSPLNPLPKSSWAFLSIANFPYAFPSAMPPPLPCSLILLGAHLLPEAHPRRGPEAPSSRVCVSLLVHPTSCLALHLLLSCPSSPVRLRCGIPECQLTQGQMAALNKNREKSTLCTYILAKENEKYR